MQDEKLCLSVREVASQLGLSLPVVYQLVKQPDFPSVNINRRIIVPRAALEHWLEKQSETASSGW